MTQILQQLIEIMQHNEAANSGFMQHDRQQRGGYRQHNGGNRNYDNR